MQVQGLIYHIFPLGAFGAEHDYHQAQQPANRLTQFHDWVPYLQSIGVSAVQFGPVFASQSHGYDTTDLYRIDPRLGTNEDFRALVEALHLAGIATVVDGVFNHVGRDFFAFQDVQKNGRESTYASWFAGLDFSRNNARGDGFAYDCWDGHDALVKLDTTNPAVREYILGAVSMWIHELGIDGIRLDAADVIDPAFWPVLRQHVDNAYHPLAPNRFNGSHFWLMGEMVHGDYAAICGPEALDSITNYELYKALYSSHNDANYFELAHALEREFSETGIYRHLQLTSFADNHDVNRIASILGDVRNLYPLHLLLFTVPGIPAIYYGSEAGVPGEKSADDWPLRPEIGYREISSRGQAPELTSAIARFATIRDSSQALKSGSYQSLHISHQQLAFLRQDGDEQAIVLANSSDSWAQVQLQTSKLNPGTYLDALDENFTLEISGSTSSGKEVIEVAIPPFWGRILQRP